MPSAPLLLLNVFLVATCGLVYELIAGTLASYVLGDSVTQFSLIIGIYLFAMGVGSWISGFIETDVAHRFVDIELAISVLGGFSAPLLYLGFARFRWFPLLLYGLVALIGVLVGTEIPLLMRILKDRLEFKNLVSRVLAFDYLGALFASLLFPLFFVPRVGLVKTSLIFGLVNAFVGLWATWLLQHSLRNVNGLRLRAALTIAVLALALIKADLLTTWAEDALFADDIVYAQTSPFQRIVMTQSETGFHLFLNGNLQFASADEYRYHEALVHPALSLLPTPRKVLILGGGDGLALREVLRYPTIASVILVDLDPAMTSLSAAFPPLGQLNQGALDDPRVRIVNQDAFVWMATCSEAFDAVIIDFPDPNSFALGKLYTTRFYRMVRACLAPEGVIAVQCTSPLFAPKSYWCVIRTLEAAGFFVRPYQTAVPSFGIWGFALAKREAFPTPSKTLPGLRFLDDHVLPTLFVIAPDLAAPPEIEINRLDNQSLVRYYESEWRRWE